MIDNRNFLNAVSEPYLNDQIGADELQQIVNDYPFFETAWLLLSRNAKLSERNDFQTILKKTAIRAHSRENLFNFIHAESVEKKQPAKIPDFNFAFFNIEDPDNLLEHEKGAAATDYFREDYGAESKIETQETIDFTGEHSFYDWLDRIESKNIETSKSEDQSGNEDLIDRFLKTRPEPIKISQESEETYEEDSRQTEQNEIIYTETMAQIYASQKLFDKAIAVYEKLRLKNPEKSSYFAEQIEKIIDLT